MPGVYTNVQLEAGLQFLPTLLTDPSFANVTGGQRVGVYPTDGGVVFEAAYKHISNITFPNIIYLGPSETGIIHIIDRVLEPPLSETATLSTVGLDAVIAVQVSLPINPKLVGIDGTVPDWTLLVLPPGFPQLESFSSLTDRYRSFAPNSSMRTTGQVPLNDLSTEAAFDAEEYHFVHGRVVYSPEFEDGMKIPTVDGNELTLTIAPNGTTYVNDVEILYTDYLISTGVVHVIERLLDPNRTEARPDLTNSTTSANSTITSVPSASASASSSSSSPLSTGAKAGIGIGVALGALLIIGLISFFFRRRKRATRPSEMSTETEKKQLGPVEMPQSEERQSGPAELPQHEKTRSQELYAPGSGQEWEIDGTESRRGRVYEM